MTLKAETPLVWTKSSYSTDEGPDCVEAATTPATVLVRAVAALRPHERGLRLQ
ncbi:DUF397 domain-containing protein, partial [Streptomyces sp. McG7]|uniref:DUF397 domain-containing protein n=1 Tax=Streptomyces sp. McG7 TaxID=2725486 RepID=UPI001BEC46C9|nr:DUF397 domain-containing protein [Streptomyces sp. McG7]